MFKLWCLPCAAVVPVATSVSADETEALKAEITKAVEKVQEAGKTKHIYIGGPCCKIFSAYVIPKNMLRLCYKLRTKSIASASLYFYVYRYLNLKKKQSFTCAFFLVL